MNNPAIPDPPTAVHLVHCLAASSNQNIYRERLYWALHSYINSKRDSHTGRAYTEGISSYPLHCRHLV